MTTNDGVTCILLVEEDAKLARTIEKALVNQGYAVDVAVESTAAITKAGANGYHVVIVDDCSLEKTGLSFLKAFHAESKRIPLLVLSSLDRKIDLTKALEEGADDFLTKPIHENELHERIRAAMWRNGSVSNPLLEAENLTMDVAKRVVRRGTTILNITRTEFSLLELLLRNKNVVLTRDHIRQQVWGSKFENGTNIVDVYINYLRTSVDKEFLPRLIHTVRGKGFVLKTN
jgi:DNA-binding response OmpR family regulator